MKSEKIIKKRGQDLTPWHQGKQGLLQLQIWPRAEEEEEEKEEEKKKSFVRKCQPHPPRSHPLLHSQVAEAEPGASLSSFSSPKIGRGNLFFILKKKKNLF